MSELLVQAKYILCFELHNLYIYLIKNETLHLTCIKLSHLSNPDLRYPITASTRHL